MLIHNYIFEIIHVLLYFGTVLFCYCLCNAILYLTWNQGVFVSIHDAVYFILFLLLFLFYVCSVDSVYVVILTCSASNKLHFY
jgi:hypothetical protein